jgi:hypothetical protein
MSASAPPTSTLNRAVTVCGGVDALAKAIDVPVESLSAWIEGDDVPTVEAYIRVLDMVAGGRDTGR